MSDWNKWNSGGRNLKRTKTSKNMALIKSLRGITPVIGENTFLADNAVIVGDVTIGKDCSIWFSTVLRGDVNTITIGDRTNIQDGVVIHTLYKRSVAVIGNDVSIGHNATIHGAKVEDKCLIGMGATLLDNVVVGTGSIVAANSLVLTGTIIEPGSMYAGVPAKKVKNVSPEQVENIIERTARDYRMYATWYTEE